MKRRKSTDVARDQTPTTFGAILARLLRRSPGARAAALIDPEGETVDYAGTLPDFFTKLVSAHLRIVLDDVTQRFARGRLGTPYQLIVRARPWSFAARRLPEGYAMVIILERQAFTLSSRALAVCDEELSREAGWPAAPRPPGSWFAVDVQPHVQDRRRPGRLRVGQRWCTLDILGHVVGLQHEQAYRCRISSGAELTLVREVSGQWFTDELIPADDDQSRRRPDFGGSVAVTAASDRSVTPPARRPRISGLTKKK